jgi:transposase
MDDAVTRQHAHPNTVFHCLYGYYNLVLSKRELANIYNKCERTIGNWVDVYERTGTFERASGNTERKFTAEQKQWLFDYYQTNALAYLDEAQDAFRRAHRVYISKTSVWRIIHDFGLTWKVLERRAIHVKETDIFRFAEELSFITWSHVNLVFLDEASFDNRGMVRRRGYALKGKKVAIRGDFQRKPRISTLAFIGVNGLIDLFDSEGTFDRVKFMECCELFIHSESNRVRPYPGPHSVWILDGASIHL